MQTSDDQPFSNFAYSSRRIKQQSNNRHDGAIKATGKTNHDEIEDFQSKRTNLKETFLPNAFMMLEGQRVKLTEKVGIRKQRNRKKASKDPSERDSAPEQSVFGERIFVKSVTTGRIASGVISSQLDKRSVRPVLQLPKADKYDITPRNFINNADCSVLKLERSKSSRIQYSIYRDNCTPRRRISDVFKHSVFKTIAHQRKVIARQPSPVSGVQMTIQELNENMSAAIKAVEESNELRSSVDDYVTQQVNKFVIKLPPIC